MNLRDRIYTYREYIEVKITKSKLNRWLGRIGQIIGVSVDGNFVWVKILRCAGEIVKFPIFHIREIERVGDFIWYKPLKFSNCIVNTTLQLHIIKEQEEIL